MSSTFRSVRESRLAAKKALDFYADLSGRPRQNIQIPEKRVRTKSPGPSEHQIQTAVISWWKHACGWHQLPEFCLLAIPNGSYRDAITGARLKSEGVRRGVPDLFLAVPVAHYAGFWLELKKPGGSASDEQLAVLDYLERHYRTAICDSFQGAIDAISQYLGVPKRG